MHVLEVNNLSVSRGGKELFRGLRFALQAGEWLHIQGANGIGKTSLLRVLSMLAQPTGGEILWCGRASSDPLSHYLSDITYAGHKPALKEELTALENLTIECALTGSDAKQSQIMQTLAAFGLKGRERVPLQILSQGQKRRVALAKLQLTSTVLWILDEPFVALDSAGIALLTKTLNEHLCKQGMIVLSSHQSVALSGPAIALDLANV